jgi:abequosyltransferase
MTRLSICIPTYNFGSYIGPTLETIIPQLEDGVEIVVLDGGSTDNTDEVVASFQKRTDALRYERRDERGGIDRDLARTVDVARGEYCWLFCADDLMKPGSVRRVLERIESGCELYLCGLTLCTPEMRPIRDHRVARVKPDRVFNLSSRAERLEYFERAQTTTAFFSFAGSLIFKRSRWEEVGADERFIGSLWAHVPRILRMIPGGLRLHYIGESYLDKRTGNDSFMERGLVHRYAKAIDGYHEIAGAYFHHGSAEARHMRRVVSSEFSPSVLLAAKLAAPAEARTVDRLAARAYGDSSLRNTVNRTIYRLTPGVAFSAAQTVNRRLVLPLRGL